MEDNLGIGFNVSGLPPPPGPLISTGAAIGFGTGLPPAKPAAGLLPPVSMGIGFPTHGLTAALPPAYQSFPLPTGGAGAGFVPSMAPQSRLGIVRGPFARPVGPIMPIPGIVHTIPTPSPIMSLPVRYTPVPVAPQENLRQHITGFLDLLNPGFTPEQLLSNLSQRSSAGASIKYIDLIRKFPTNGSIIVADSNSDHGTYGTIRDVTYPIGGLIKYAIFPNNDSGNLKIKQFLKESFIQYILNKGLPQHIPTVYGIFKEITPSGDIKVSIWMQKAKYTILDKIKIVLKKFNLFYDLFMNLLIVLNDLSATYNFAHRDLKTNNLVIMPDNHIGLIDFGFSTITLNLDGINYKIANDRAYNYELECNPKQDMGLLLTEIYGDYSGYIRDPDITQFFDTIFVGGRMNPLIKKIKTRQNEKGSTLLFHGAYNYNGTLYSCDLSNTITVENVTNVLNDIKAQREARIAAASSTGSVQGGRRTIKRYNRKRRARKTRQRK